MFLIGSKLVKKLFPDFREPRDIDWVVNDITKLKPHKNGEEFYYVKPTPDREMTADEIYTYKISHMNYSFGWDKVYEDVLFLRSKGCKVIPEYLKELRDFWATNRVGLGMSNEEQMKIVRELENE
jgi:hypothetical protein